MPKLYKQHMLDILDKLSIAAPTHIEMDQMQIELLLGKIKVALDTYDPLPTGNATVADVKAGKTFSNATGTGLTGTGDFLDLATATLPQLPTPVLSLNAAEKQLVIAYAPLFTQFFTSIDIIDDEGTKIGEAEEGSTNPPYYVFDISALIAEGGEHVVGAVYRGIDVIEDSDPDAIVFFTADVTRVLTHCTDSNTDAKTLGGHAIIGTITPDEGYDLPETITVTIGGTPKAAGSDYVWSSTTGAYEIYSDVMGTGGAVVITVTATESVG